MAIQMRRGAYTDFDASRLVAGESAVVLSGDPDTSDGTAVYFATGDGTAKRIMYANEFGSGSVTTAKVADGAITGGKIDDALAKRPVQTFDTVATMQAATWLKSGMTCHTNGFHAAGDGGAAYYTIGTTRTANGMDVLACANSLIATLVVTEPYVTPEQFGAYGDDTHDDSEYINFALQTYRNVRLGRKTYRVSQPIIVDRPIDLQGAGIGNTTITCDSGTQGIKILPYTANAIGENGFSVGGFFLKGNDSGTGIAYDNNGLTTNYIARWDIHDIRVEDFSAGIEFENQQVADGYFVGGFTRLYCNCPIKFVRAGDSWFIRDSQLYKNAKITLDRVASGARKITFENINYAAQGMKLHGNGISVVRCQIESTTTPAIEFVGGYENVIDNCSINTLDMSAEPLVRFNTGLTANQGLKNAIINSTLVQPTNTTAKLIVANDKVEITGCDFYLHAGAHIADYGALVEGPYIDGSHDWTLTGGSSVTPNPYTATYEKGFLNIDLRANATLTNAASGTVLLNLSGGGQFKSGAYVPFKAIYSNGTAWTTVPSYAQTATPLTINLINKAGSTQTLADFIIAGRVPCAI